MANTTKHSQKCPRNSLRYGTNKNIRGVLLAALALCLTSCTTSDVGTTRESVDSKMARIELEKSHRIPSLFSEHWFGTLVRVRDLSGQVVFAAKSKSSEDHQIQSLDLRPGTYTLLVLCRTHTPFKGSGSASLASMQVTLVPGETKQLECESYEYEEEIDSPSGKEKRTVYEVRLVED